jgi:hypothetical protein
MFYYVGQKGLKRNSAGNVSGAESPPAKEIISGFWSSFNISLIAERLILLPEYERK